MSLRQTPEKTKDVRFSCDTFYFNGCGSIIAKERLHTSDLFSFINKVFSLFNPNEFATPQWMRMNSVTLSPPTSSLIVYHMGFWTRMPLPHEILGVLKKHSAFLHLNESNEMTANWQDYGTQIFMISVIFYQNKNSLFLVSFPIVCTFHWRVYKEKTVSTWNISGVLERGRGKNCIRKWAVVYGLLISRFSINLV